MMKFYVFIAMAFAVLLCGCGTAHHNGFGYLTVATFNLEWLGDGVDDKMRRSDADYLAIADIMLKTDADVIAVQEVENNQALHKVVRYMSGYKYFLSQGGAKQRVGFVVRNTVEFTPIGDYTPLQLDRPDRLRPGFAAMCSKGALTCLMMSVHLKSTSRYDSTNELRQLSRELRGQQAQVLHNFVDSVLEAGNEHDILLCGDFNDYPGRRQNPTLTALENGHVTFVTAGLTSCANPKWTVIDHVAASAKMTDRVNTSTVRVENHRVYLDDEASAMVSDHCAVVAQFEVSTPDVDRYYE